MSKNGKSAPPTATQPKVFWAVLLERAVQIRAVNSLLNVAAVGGLYGFTRLVQPYMRTDLARNNLIAKFLSESKSPEDVLVMLDNDHEFDDPYIVAKLAASPHGVTGALAFRRGQPFDPCMYVRCGDNKLHPLASWPKGSMMACQMVGHGAIAIKRRVFDDLLAFGFKAPYYRYEYPDDGRTPSEDMYFGAVCEAVGINHYCDTSLIIPHLTDDVIDDRTWQGWLALNPNNVAPVEQIGAEPPDLKTAVIMPSRGRAEQLVRCLRRLFETTGNHDVSAVVLLDTDDTPSIEAVKALNDPRVVLHIDGGTPIEKWNTGAVIASRLGVQALALGADDLWWGDGWFEAAMRGLTHLPDRSGLVGFNEMTGARRDFSTHYLMTLDYLIDYNGGVFACPKYLSYFIDPEACARAVRAGRYYYAEDCEVEHRHPFWHKANQDDTYQRSAPNYEHDQAIYEERYRAAFPDDFEPMITREAV